jgi:hypothetical protein
MEVEVQHRVSEVGSGLAPDQLKFCMQNEKKGRSRGAQERILGYSGLTHHKSEFEMQFEAPAPALRAVLVGHLLRKRDAVVELMRAGQPVGRPLGAQGPDSEDADRSDGDDHRFG